MNNGYYYNNNYNNASAGERISVNEYMQKTFYLMFLGLLATFAVAYFGFKTGFVYRMCQSMGLVLFILAAQVIFVMVLSAKVQQLSVGTATGLFFGYAVLNGFAFSVYFAVYSASTLNLVFILAALFFFAMATYGKVTKRDLSNLRSLLFGGMIFLAVFWLISMFLNLSAFEGIVCVVGLLIFMGVTAYDMQRIKDYYSYYSYDAEMVEKSAIFSALQLYLDFINIFVYLLRILGSRRRD